LHVVVGTETFVCGYCMDSIAARRIVHPRLDPGAYAEVLNRLFWFAGFVGAVDPAAYDSSTAVDHQLPSPPIDAVAARVRQRSIVDFLIVAR